METIFKPELKYVELHLTDHCNLNCKGCGHFSPLATKWFANIETYKNDIKRLTELFSTIEMIRLMGGEPLLHPEVNSFISSTKKHFPISDIHIVTNGLLLPKMDDDFFLICKENHIIIDITVYPLTETKIKSILTILVKEEKIKINVRHVNMFHAHRNFRGDSDPLKAFKNCRAQYYCPFLKEGKLYHCALPAVAKYANTSFGIQIPETGYVDLFEKNIIGSKIIEVLNQPSDACKFCSYSFTPFEWTTSRKAIEEWDPQY